MNISLVEIPVELSMPFFEMKKKDADLYLNWFLSIKQERLNILSEQVKLLEEWNCNFSRESLNPLFNYFRKVIKYRDMTDEEKGKEAEKITGILKGNIEVPTKVLDEESVSICFDIGIYFGETMIKQIPFLKWGYSLTPKRYVHYGQPIVIKEGKFIDLNPRALMEVLAMKVLNNEEASLINLYDTWIVLLKK